MNISNNDNGKMNSSSIFDNLDEEIEETRKLKPSEKLNKKDISDVFDNLDEEIEETRKLKPSEKSNKSVPGA